MTAFPAGLLTGDLPAWSHDQWLALANSRRQERVTKKYAQPLPPALDAALLVMAAQMLLAAAQESAAAQMAAWAVDEVPGHKSLCAWEGSIAASQSPIKIDLTALILGIEPEADATSEPEAGCGTDAAPEAVRPPIGDQPKASG